MNNKKRPSGAPKLVRPCLAPGCKRLTLRGICGPCFATEELRRIFSSIAVKDRN